jgi:hypothetical protein
MNWDGIVSLLFFSIEVILLLNLLYFGRKNKSVRNGILVVAFLSAYQLTEYLICGAGLKYSIVAFAAISIISFLPVLSLIFVLDLLNKRFRYDKLLFIPMLLLILYYMMVIPEFQVARCTVMYAVYNYPLGDVYGLLYYLPLLSLLILLFSGLKTEDEGTRNDIKILIAGNLFTLIPVISAFALKFSGNDNLLMMIESVMCKFALVLAVTYSIVILNLIRER